MSRVSPAPWDNQGEGGYRVDYNPFMDKQDPGMFLLAYRVWLRWILAQRRRYSLHHIRTGARVGLCLDTGLQGEHCATRRVKVAIAQYLRQGGVKASYLVGEAEGKLLASQLHEMTIAQMAHSHSFDLVVIGRCLTWSDEKHVLRHRLVMEMFDQQGNQVFLPGSSHWQASAAVGHHTAYRLLAQIGSLHILQALELVAPRKQRWFPLRRGLAPWIARLHRS